MEGHAGCSERKLQPLKLSTDSNGLPLIPGDDTSHHYAMENGISGRQISCSYLPQSWVQSEKPSPNYVEFLDEGSMFMTKAPVENIIESLPADSTLPVHEVFPIHGEMSFNNYPGNSHTADSCIEARKSCTSWMQDLNGDNYNASHLHAKATSSTPGAAWPKRRTSLTDRRRRLRIAERLTALQELLPQSVRGSQASALDDVIDHIKYLQLQIKDLSQSKLRGESTSEPFIFLEGYGHYISNQQMLNEPLEEMLGKLLEVNPSAAAQLLNSKGLYLMPLDLAPGLC